MNILIVENERPAADKMVTMLRNIDKTINITDVVETVEGVINLIQAGLAPDLILMDIQLDDGLCFEIFETINIETPVIFTTAYDEYTLRAFKVNSVDYLLKPVDENSLKAALTKFRKLHYDTPDLLKRDFRHLLNEFRNQYKSRFLIRIGDKFKSVQTKDISHFHINERSVFLNDVNGRDYSIDYSLEQLQDVIDPAQFFRINRECIVNIDSISLLYSYSSSRLQVTLKANEKKDIFIVSRDKVADFKKWIDR